MGETTQLRVALPLLPHDDDEGQYFSRRWKIGRVRRVYRSIPARQLAVVRLGALKLPL